MRIMQVFSLQFTEVVPNVFAVFCCRLQLLRSIMQVRSAVWDSRNVATRCNWVCLKIVYPSKTQWFCWSLSLLNGYFIGNIPYFQTNPTRETDTLRLAVQFQGGASQSRERHRCKVVTERRVEKIKVHQAAGSSIEKKSDRLWFFCKKNQKAFQVANNMQNLMEPRTTYGGWMPRGRVATE